MSNSPYPLAAAEGASFIMAPAGEDLDWQGQGACRHDPNPDKWTPDGHGLDKQSQEAVEICKTMCPVRQQCAEWAIKNREQWGVWGGLTERQRRRIFKMSTRSGRKLLEEAS